MHSSHDAVKMLQSMWAHPDPVQEAQGPHQHNCAEGAVLFPATECGDHVCGERNEASGSFEAAREVDIFHERNIREGADSLDLASDEEGLVAVAMPLHLIAGSSCLQQSCHGAIRVKANVEPPADGGRVRAVLGNGLCGTGWEQGIGIEESQTSTVAGGRTGIELNEHGPAAPTEGDGGGLRHRE